MPLTPPFAVAGARSSGAPDEALLARFREGDRAAFDALVRRYQDRVYGLCLRWLGEPESAEEIAQDVFLALYRSLPDFRGDAQLSTYVFRACVNHCRNRRAHRARRAWGRHEPLEAPDGRPRDLHDDANRGADAGAHAADARRLVAAALDALDDELRAIVLLRDVQDLDYDEIADILEIPRGTVKSRLHRARTELAAALVARGALSAGPGPLGGPPSKPGGAR
jgi:RNA polymerase sigma-70 factor (ECF subfamily)